MPEQCKWFITMESQYLLPEQIAEQASGASDMAKYLGVLRLGVLKIRDEFGNEYYIIARKDFEEWYGDI